MIVKNQTKELKKVKRVLDVYGESCMDLRHFYNLFNSFQKEQYVEALKYYEKLQN